MRRTLRRVRLFVRDYFQEFGVAWSVARHRDCERNGGHRWGGAHQDAHFGWQRTCSRCGTSETIPQSSSGSASYYWVSPNSPFGI